MANPINYLIQAQGNTPWIYPNGITSGNITFVIKGIGTPSPVSSTKGGFSLATDGIVTISTTALTSLYTDTDRGSIKTDFDSFKEALDAATGLTPGSLRIIVSTVAQWLPMPIAEIPLYAYNLCNREKYTFLTATQKYIDLQPGMRLKVLFANMYIENEIHAFSGTGTDYIHINSVKDSNELSFSTALNSQEVKVDTIIGTNTRVAATAIDLMTSKPYQRLVYPSVPFTAIDSPNDDPGVNTTIIRSDSYSDLETATSKFPSANAGQGEYALFFGRSQIVPEISIHVNGTQMYVPVGTTLRHMVERHFVSPLRPKTLKFNRFLGGTAVPLKYNDSSIGYDMYLLSGDNISW